MEYSLLFHRWNHMVIIVKSKHDSAYWATVLGGNDSGLIISDWEPVTWFQQGGHIAHVTGLPLLDELGWREIDLELD